MPKTHKKDGHTTVNFLCDRPFLHSLSMIDQLLFISARDFQGNGLFRFPCTESWAMLVRAAPPPAAGFADDKAGNRQSQIEAGKKPVLTLHEHDRAKGPGKHFKGRIERTDNSRIIQRFGLVVGIDDTQQDEPDGKDACRIAVYEERPFKPAFVIHLRADNPEHVRNDDHAHDEQHKKGNSVLDDDGNLDRGNAEEDKIVRRRAGNAADNPVVNVIVSRRPFQDEEEAHAEQEGKQVTRQIQTGTLIDEIHDEPSGTGAGQKQSQMESQRIQCRRRNGFIPHGLTVFLGNQPGLQVAGNIGKILDVRRIASAGCHFRIDKPASRPTVAQVMPISLASSNPICARADPTAAAVP